MTIFMSSVSLKNCTSLPISHFVIIEEEVWNKTEESINVRFAVLTGVLMKIRDLSDMRSRQQVVCSQSIVFLK
jgi:hypothetical protein